MPVTANVKVEYDDNLILAAIAALPIAVGNIELPGPTALKNRTLII
jgi:hypothetical protein